MNAAHLSPPGARIRDIVIYGDPVLRKTGRPVGPIDERIRALAADMLTTMYDAAGVGLAAQQIGETLQLAVVDITAAADQPSAIFVGGEERDPSDYMPLYLIDAVVEPVATRRETANEGCLSFPEIAGDIPRHDRIRVRTRTLEDGVFEFEAAGWLARAIQHEHDHLQGILFIDRMSPAAKAGLSGKLKRLAKRADR